MTMEKYGNAVRADQVRALALNRTRLAELRLGQVKTAAESSLEAQLTQEIADLEAALTEPSQ